MQMFASYNCITGNCIQGILTFLIHCVSFLPQQVKKTTHSDKLVGDVWRQQNSMESRDMSSEAHSPSFHLGLWGRGESTTAVRWRHRVCIDEAAIMCHFNVSSLPYVASSHWACRQSRSNERQLRCELPLFLTIENMTARKKTPSQNNTRSWSHYHNYNGQPAPSMGSSCD